MSRRILPGAALLLMVLAMLFALVSQRPFMSRLALLLQGGFGASLPNAFLFLLAQIGVAALGFVPASLMAITAGATYGAVQGFCLSAVGLMIGGSLAFLISRSALRPWVEKWVSRHPRFVRLERAVGADGWRFVCLVRMSPIMPFALTSYCLGLTRIDHRAFVLGTLASLPSLACFVAMGALGQAGWQARRTGIDYVNIALIAVGIIATLLVTWRIRIFLRQSAESVTTAPAEG